MKYPYLIADPSGNTTAFVWADVPAEDRGAAARRVMDELQAEQVAFVHHGRMDMMGGEFCGNASRSFALVQALYRADGTWAELNGTHIETVCVSGADHPLEVTLHRDGDALSAAIQMPLPAAILPLRDHRLGLCTLVQYPGISHIIVQGRPYSDDHLAAARALVEAYVPAGPARECFGLMYLTGCRLRPLVYVAGTDTLIWESSCASGSCAVAAAKAFLTQTTVELELFQPGGSLKTKAQLQAGKLSVLTLDGPVSFPSAGKIHL